MHDHHAKAANLRTGLTRLSMNQHTVVSSMRGHMKHENALNKGETAR